MNTEPTILRQLFTALNNRINECQEEIKSSETRQSGTIGYWKSELKHAQQAQKIILRRSKQ